MLFLLAALAVPIAGLLVLLAAPDADVHWEHHPAHFWLVLGTALISVALGFLTSEAARRLDDARLFLVSMAFVTSAGFLGLHALATPGVLLEGKNAGFVIATPVGLLIAGFFAAASALDLGPRGAALMRHRVLIRNGVIVLLAAWAAISVAERGPINEPLPPEEADGWLYSLAAVGLVLYGFAAVRYLGLYRARRARLPLAVFVAFALLAEAMVAIAVGRNWHASWWEWHVLMAAGFGLVAVAVRDEYRARRSLAGVFSDLYLDRTMELVDKRYARALQDVVHAQERGQDTSAAVKGMSAEEVELLERAAGEIRRLDDLFRPYLAPQLTARLRADPGAADLGGEEREISVLFADLQGFTAFSERHEPGQVVSMLNEYWARAVPAVTEQGGMIERFAGDAVMAVFNAAGDEPDHAVRAARAALALQRATADVSGRRPEWPTFRAGVNTGRAVVGNVGSAEQRSFTAIGDTTNLAARLQSEAEPGQVVIGPATLAALGDGALVRPLGGLELKGKSEPVEAFVLVELDADSL
jgi:adenylate cyclase